MPNDTMPNDYAHLHDMLQLARETRDIAAGRNFEEFYSDRVVLRACERTLELLGEAARRVSDDFKHRHPHIPWRNLIGQRNVLAHDYGDIEYGLLFATVQEDLPGLIIELEALLEV